MKMLLREFTQSLLTTFFAGVALCGIYPLMTLEIHRWGSSPQTLSSHEPIESKEILSSELMAIPSDAKEL